MGTTIHVERIGRTPTTAIEICHSPDEGIYYLSNVDFQRRRSRVSKGEYRTDDAARAAFQFGRVEWEEWH